MSTQNRANLTPVQIHADHASQKRLGNWTTARVFQVRARHAQVTIDLRSPQIPAGDIELSLDLDHSTVKLLVAGDAVIDHWHLAWTGTRQGQADLPPQPGRHRPPDPPDRAGPSRRGPGAKRRDGPAVGDRVARILRSTPVAPTPRAAHPPWTTPPAAPDAEERGHPYIRRRMR